MINPFKKNRFSPKKSPAANGYGESGKIAFSNSERTWEEKYNLVEGLVELLRHEDIECTVERGWILLDGTTYLRPEMITIQPLEPSGVKTTSIISICNEKHAPDGFFEYQHSTGEDTQASFNAGFASWLNMDLPAIRDTFNETTSECTRMEMSFDGGRPPRVAILSPVSHYASKDFVVDEDHPFCPCCFLTKNFEIFRAHFEKDKFSAIRFLAMRNEDGSLGADCRINGIDYPDGESALLSYAGTWPGNGFEMRKQYVIFYTPTTL